MCGDTPSGSPAARHSRSSRYRHAARHLLECESLASSVPDWNGFELHAAYVARLKAQHGRKAHRQAVVCRQRADRRRRHLRHAVDPSAQMHALCDQFALRPRIAAEMSVHRTDKAEVADGRPVAEQVFAARKVRVEQIESACGPAVHRCELSRHDADARQIIKGLVALEDPDAMARAAEQRRGQHSGRPVPGNQNVVHYELTLGMVIERMGVR